MQLQPRSIIPRLLVLNAQGAEEERISIGEDQKPSRLAEHHQKRGLPILPCARNARYPDDQQTIWHLQGFRLPRGRTACKQAARRCSWRATSAGSTRCARLGCLAMDGSHRCRRVPFAKPDRPQGIARKVVITEWDGAVRILTFTMKSRPTAGTRR